MAHLHLDHVEWHLSANGLGAKSVTQSVGGGVKYLPMHERMHAGNLYRSEEKDLDMFIWLKVYQGCHLDLV